MLAGVQTPNMGLVYYQNDVLRVLGQTTNEI